MHNGQRYKYGSKLAPNYELFLIDMDSFGFSVHQLQGQHKKWHLRHLLSYLNTIIWVTKIFISINIFKIWSEFHCQMFSLVNCNYSFKVVLHYYFQERRNYQNFFFVKHTMRSKIPHAFLLSELERKLPEGNCYGPNVQKIIEAEFTFLHLHSAYIFRHGFINSCL